MAAALMAAGPGGCGDFERGFNTSFAKKTHDSCVTSAIAHGGAPAAVEKYCTCVVTQLAPLSVQEKMSLGPNSPKLNQAMQACLAQAQQP